jgi:hypothetical protein
MRPGVLFGAFVPAAGSRRSTTPPGDVSAVFERLSRRPSVRRPRRPCAPVPKLDAVGALLTAALPADGMADLVLIDWPGTPGTPHVRAVTVVGAAPAAIKNVLLDGANYRKIVPTLIRADVGRTQAGLPSVGWEVEVPLFNLSGTLVIHERPDGAEIDLVDGDFSPGKLIFTAIPRAAGGSTLLIDAQLNIGNAGWLIRRLVKLSPAGEPAALVAASYVTCARWACARRTRGSAARAAGRDAGAAARAGRRRRALWPTRSWRRCARTAPSRWSDAPGRSGSRRGGRHHGRRSDAERARAGCAIRRAGTRSRAGAPSNRARARTAVGAKVEDSLPFVDLGGDMDGRSRVIRCAGPPPTA